MMLDFRLCSCVILISFGVRLIVVILVFFLVSVLLSRLLL